MDSLHLHCHPNSTLFDRLRKLAEERNRSVEDLALEAIYEFLGEYGLKEVPPDFPAKTMDDLLFAHGLTKTPGTFFSGPFPRAGSKEEVCQSTTRTPGSEE